MFSSHKSLNSTTTASKWLDQQTKKYVGVISTAILDHLYPYLLVIIGIVLLLCVLLITILVVVCMVLKQCAFLTEQQGHLHYRSNLSTITQDTTSSVVQ